jgi:hypothetical protein
MSRRHITPDLRAESDPDAITCHALRHSWDPIGSGDRIPEFGALLCLRCVRCGTLRYDRFSRLTGQRIGTPQYVYPDVYRDTEGHDMDWWRQAMGEVFYAQGLIVDAEDEVGTKRRRARKAAS